MDSMSVGDEGALPVRPRAVATGRMLMGALVVLLLMITIAPNAAAVQGGEEPATTQPTADDGGSDNPSTSAAGDGAASDSSNTQLIILTTITSLVVIVLIATRRRTRPSPRAATGSFRHWPIRAESVVQEGREVVDLTMAGHPGEDASGLTVSELGNLASRLELLVAHLSDLKKTAPSADAHSALGLATAHASQLSGLVQTERRLHLSSSSPDETMLAGLAIQLASERTALDDALCTLSQSKEDLR